MNPSALRTRWGNNLNEDLYQFVPDPLDPSIDVENVHGNSLVFSHRVTEHQRREIRSTVQWLTSLYPQDTGRVVIADVGEARKYRLDHDSDTGASCNDTILLTNCLDMPTRKSAMNAQVGWWPKVAAETTPITFTLVHEWGHTKDASIFREPVHVKEMKVLRNLMLGTLDDYQKSLRDIARHSNTTQRVFRSVAMRDQALPSRQSQKDPQEAFAEAFAEWHISLGQTRNRFTRELAHSEGWHQFA